MKNNEPQPEKNKAHKPLQFIGDKLKENITVPRKDKPEDKPQTLYNYIPDAELVRAVNLAMLLEMPLLVMGEPGCGKSLLAKAVAYDIHEQDMFEYYREWHIKSTSKAKEGLYEFDYVRRLRDATVKGQAGDIQNVDKYIRLGPMGEAFTLSVDPEKRPILLIDEIDKADIDFPNDLLNELDRMEFDIPEKKIEEEEGAKKTIPSTAKKTAFKKGLTGTIKAVFRPVVIITSNSEKDLPDAFLRRCIFHYIKPLSDAKLKEIVLGRYYSKEATSTDPLIDKAITVFVNLRDTIKNELLSIGKNVSTSEFLNWFQALKYYNDVSNKKIKADNNSSLQQLLDDITKLDTETLARIPFSNILLKNINSVIRFNETPQKI